MNKNINNMNEVMKNEVMNEMYVKPECTVYAIETEGVLCGSGEQSFTPGENNFGGSWGNPRGW